MFRHVIDDNIELRLVDRDHSEEMFKSIDSSREHLRKYLPWVDITKSSDDTKAFIESSKKQYAANNGFNAGIWYKGQFAGVIGYHDINHGKK